MRKLLTALVIIVSMAAAGSVCAQDLMRHQMDIMKGMQAYISGDYATAAREFKALTGNSNAMNILGGMYELGKGVVRDDRKAVKWYRKAAELGDAKAQWRLGFMYAFGKGVIKNNVYSHMWYNIAASQGITGPAKSRDIVADMMTAADISKAQDLARECVRKKYKGC